ncbi:MAG: metallophosphoesterase [Bacteroidaceae bacterium]|nr:metallophosphoesterase [Bacteroidaceae bacterium]
MKKTCLFLCMLAMAISAFSQDYLKLMTYNIRNAKGMDGVCNFQRIANVISNEAPDVVAIQELDSMTTRSGQKFVLNEIAERTQMHASYAPAISFQGGKYGIGILSRKKPLDIHSYPLPGREEARMLMVAEFEDYFFACTHLSLTEEDRLASLDIIKKSVGKSDKPYFLAGDLNDTPDSKFIKALQQDFQVLTNLKKPTFPAPEPTETIDYIAVWKHRTNNFANLSAQVHEEPLASDHRPLTVQLRTAIKADKIFLTRPYLQNPANNGMTIMWETSIPTYSWVEYGTDTTLLSRARLLIDGQAEFNESIHKIRLEELIPGQTYYYRVCSQEILQYKAYSKKFGHTAKSEFHSFTMPATDTDSFTAVIFNDLHQRSAVFQALLKQVKQIDYDFVIFNGDCIDDPINHAQATRFVKELTEGVGGNLIPTLFMRGNHEIRNAYSVGLRKHMDYVGGKTYGAFNWGDTRIVMLDCGEDKPDSTPVYYDLNDFTQLRQDQAGFLKEELKSKEFKKADKRILIHHIPLYGCDNLCWDLWEPLLRKAPFHVSINAHTHKFAYHPKGTLKNNYPVVIGGGNKLGNATVMIIEKKKGELRIKVLNVEGNVLLDIVK